MTTTTQKAKDAYKGANHGTLKFNEFTTVCTIKEHVIYQSEITELPTEDGSTISNNVVNKPLVLEIEGVTTDIFIPPNAIDNLLNKALDPIGAVQAYLPPKTQAFVQRADAAFNFVYSNVQSAISYLNRGISILKAFGLVDGSETSTQRFLNYVDALHFTKTPIAVAFAIPGRAAIYHNMYIEQADLSVDNELENISFNIAFKQVLTGKQIKAKQQEKIGLSSALSPTPSPATKGSTDGLSKLKQTAGNFVENASDKLSHLL